jgi:hypothetical protein
MCFTIDKNSSKAITSDHDIICFKILFKTENSSEAESIAYPYNHRYKLNEINEIINLIPQDHLIEGRQPIINRGYHSFISLDHLKRSWMYTTTHEYPMIITGECVIPKGYQYYVNYETGEYVSESIILKKLYESNESGSNRPSEE